MRETSWGRVKYRTTNWKAYNAALKARGELTIWLDRDMQWLAQPTGKRGRCQKFSDAAIQFCLTIKCLFGQPLRQTLGLVESLLGMAGLDWPVPDYSTVCRRQKSLDVQVRYCPELEIRRQNLSMLARMSSADLIHTNGLGSELFSSKYWRIACSSCLVDRCVPRRMYFSVRVANQRST